MSILFVGSFLGVSSAFAKKARKSGRVGPCPLRLEPRYAAERRHRVSTLPFSRIGILPWSAPAILSEAVGVIGAVNSSTEFTQILVGVLRCGP